MMSFLDYSLIIYFSWLFFDYFFFQLFCDQGRVVEHQGGVSPKIRGENQGGVSPKTNWRIRAGFFYKRTAQTRAGFYYSDMKSKCTHKLIVVAILKESFSAVDLHWQRSKRGWSSRWFSIHDIHSWSLHSDYTIDPVLVVLTVETEIRGESFSC